MEEEETENTRLRRLRIAAQRNRTEEWARWLSAELDLPVVAGPRGLVMLDPEQLADLLVDP